MGRNQPSESFEAGSSVNAKQVGDLIRSMRKQRGIKALFVANDLHINSSRLSRIENGHSLPRRDELEALLDYFEADNRTRSMLSKRFDESRTNSQVRLTVHESYAEIQAREWDEVCAATSSRWMFTRLIPGVLQIPPYVYAIFNGGIGSEGHDDDDIAEAVRIRLEAQQIIYDLSKSFEFVIFAEALYFRPLSPIDLAAQCARIAQIALMPNVDLCVVPVGAEMPLEIVPDLMILNGEVLHKSLYGLHSHENSPSVVHEYNEIFDACKAVALTGLPAQELLSAIAMEHVNTAAAKTA